MDASYGYHSVAISVLNKGHQTRFRVTSDRRSSTVKARDTSDDIPTGSNEIVLKYLWMPINTILAERVRIITHITY